MASTPEDGDRDTAAERIRKLKAEVAALAGGNDRIFTAPGVPPGVEEQFWRQVLAFEHAPLAKPYDVLVRAGLTIPAPDELDDARLSDKLWEVIDALAAIRIFLLWTDHLSDRELYARLWNELLHDDVEMIDDDNAATHMDCNGTGSEEDVQAYLKYYAADDTRESWAKNYPDVFMPDRAPRPYDRDRRLPQSGW